jgi:hypothetical protein
MKLRISPASQGFAWFRQGVQVCLRQPMGFVGLVGMVVASALLLASVPLIGAMVVVGLMPLAWMGFMLATRQVVLGERVMPAVLIEAVRHPDSPRAGFARLGGAYVAATLLVMLLAQWLGPGAEVLAEAMQSAEDAEALLDNPLVVEDMAWRLGLTLPVSLVFWHAPALVLWGRLPVAKALFFSAVASWRNIGAFAVYGLSWVGAMFALALVSRLLSSALPVPAIANVLTFAAVLWLAAAFYASLYFSVVDCFESGAQAEAPPEA